MYDNMDRENNYNTMIVTGRGQVTAMPDIVLIRLGVQTSGENLAFVQEENARSSQMVLEGLRQMGVQDIRTYQYIIDRIYDFDNNTRIDRGFSVRNVFEIRTDMLDMAGTIIDTAVSLGANLVDLITFEVSATDQYYLEALNLALMNGTEKARSMAEGFNTRLNPVPRRIVENSSPPVPLSRTFLREDIITTPIEPGTSNIQAFVTLEFDYI